MMIAKLPSRAQKRRRSTSGAALLGVLVMCACGSVPRTRYYTLSMPAPAPSGDPPTNFVLDVPRFQAADTLRDDRILYYESPTQLNHYEYHRWSAPPADLMAERVAQRLRSMGVFAEVRLFARAAPGDYVLGGRLLSFEELDYEAGGRVRVGLELELLRTSDHKIIWSETRRSERGIQGKGVANVVTALNASAAQVLNEALPGLVAQVQRDSAQAPGHAP